MGKFVIRKNRSGYVYHFEGEDALIYGYSDPHRTLASARIGIESIRSVAAECRIEDRTQEKLRPLRSPKFGIYRDGNKRLRFRMRAKNGQQILKSVPFKEMDDVLATIGIIKETAAGSSVQD